MLYNYSVKIILGSKSKGRKQVLEDAGYKFDIMVSDINEEAIRHDDLSLLPLLIARGKMNALLPKISEEAILITSDQIVVYNGELREKPRDKEEARIWLESYSNNISTAITSVVVMNTKTGSVSEGVDTVNVHFKKIPHTVIDKLIEKGMVLHTAGACVGEDPLLNPYIQKLEGELDSLTGLPMKLTEKLMHDVGYRNGR